MLYKDQFSQLKKWGFDVAYNKVLPKLSESILEKILTERKNDSEYEIDGIVCFDDSEIHDLKFGNPDYGFAFKMIIKDQIVITNVKEVIWDISMNKFLKPRVKFEPVELLGTTVTYATAHNAKYIVNNKIGKGAIIKIIKSGDVIPYILEVVKPAKEIGLPENITYKWNETKVNFVAMEIKGEAKERVNVKLLMHFFKYMGIKHLSEGILTKFVENGFDTLSKILKAKNKLEKIEGLGEKSITKIFDQISNSFKNVKLHTFMAASHVFGTGLGERKIEEITNTYPNILTIKWSKTKMIEKLLEIDGFGKKLATLFADNFDDFIKFYKEINKIIDISRFEKAKQTEKLSGNMFDGKIFVFTGFRDKDLEQFIKNNGGKTTTSISSKTYMLIHSDSEIDKPSQKILSARELNIKTMSKSGFEKKYK
jgi:NAD-dependent DNA ligase